MGWTRHTYDNAGRLTEAATFSGDTSPGQSYNNLTGKTTYSYDGPCHTMKDQAANAYNYIFKSASQKYAVTFGFSYLAENEIDDLLSGLDTSAAGQ